MTPRQTQLARHALGLNRATLNALERVFSAEIDGRLPFQSKAKIFRDLCDSGLLQPMTRTFGGRLAIIATGYQLTHAGRFVYCANCEGPGENLDGEDFPG